MVDNKGKTPLWYAIEGEKRKNYIENRNSWIAELRSLDFH